MSIESEIAKQYEEFYRQNDWSTFKYAADYYLENAAKVLKKDIKYQDDTMKLLFRNIQKRLYIGIACELLLKAIYLKAGYVINKRKIRDKPKGSAPFLANQISNNDFLTNKTLTFNDLLQKIFKVINIQGIDKKIVDKGLRIAKVFRNKEGHSISLVHKYDPQNYRDIEECLRLLYKQVFNEDLSLVIAFGADEIGIFKIN